MADCAPVLVATAVHYEIQAKTDWSLTFVPRLSWANFKEKLVDTATELMVDVVPFVRPTLVLETRDSLNHIIPVTLGVRKLLAGKSRRSDDGSIGFSEVSPYVNLLYELARYFLPDSDDALGRRLSTCTAAVVEPMLEIVKVWDPDQLITHSQYTGIVRLRYRYNEDI